MRLSSKSVALVFSVAFIALALFTGSAAGQTGRGTEVQRASHEVKKNQSAIKQERQEVRRDSQELPKGDVDLEEDRRNFPEDIRSGDIKDEIAKDRQEFRKVSWQSHFFQEPNPTLFDPRLSEVR